MTRFVPTLKNGSYHSSLQKQSRTKANIMASMIGASLSEPHIDGTAGRFHKCIMVRPSPARHGRSHEVCRASVTTRGSRYSCTARKVLYTSTVQCGRRRRQETLRRSSWSVNVYCTRAGSCEVATYRTQKAAEIL